MQDNSNDSPDSTTPPHEQPPGAIPEELPDQAKNLEYEETPIIAPIEYIGSSSIPTNEPHIEAVPPIQTNATEPPKEDAWKPESTPPIKPKPHRMLHVLTTIIFLVLLFGLGIGMSVLLRTFLPNGISLQSNNVITPTPTVYEVPTPAQLAWINYPKYTIISGLTRQSIEVYFQLPPDILPPVCDGPSCASQGTYLPGGTRFTVAARGEDQILPDFRGRLLSDIAGQTFQVSDSTVFGKPAKEFSGLFTGTTSGGYAFGQMHGFMIEVNENLSVEINHFTPSGVNADFASDDRLFRQIVDTVTITLPASGNSIQLSPTLSPTP